MARVEHSDSWTAPGTVEEVRGKIGKFLKDQKFTLKAGEDNEIIGIQGSHFYSALREGPYGDPKFWPIYLTIKLTGSTSKVHVDFYIRDNFWTIFTYLGGTWRELYKKTFEVLSENLKNASSGIEREPLPYPPPTEKPLYYKFIMAIANFIPIIMLLGGLIYVLSLCIIGNPIPATFRFEGSEWAEIWRGFGKIYILDMTEKNEDEVYIVGFKTRIADFDPGWGMNIHTSSDADEILLITTFYGYMAKLNDNGKVIAVYDVPGIPESLAIVSDGSIIITGEISRTADFDIGPGEIPYASPEPENKYYYENYIVKYDPDMQYKWHRTWKGQSFANRTNSIEMDSDDNLYVSGFFEGEIDLSLLDSESDLIVTGGPNSGFLFKFDNFGNPEWIYPFNSSDYGSSNEMDVDPDGNVYISNGWDIGKIDADGQAVWKLNFRPVAITGLTITSDGKIFLTGNSEWEFDINEAPGVQTSMRCTDDYDIYVAEIDSNGNYRWGMLWGEDKWDIAMDIASDSSDNIYFTGYLNHDTGKAMGPVGDVFVGMIDSINQIQWINTGEGNMMGEGVVVTEVGNMYVFGKSGGFSSFLAKFNLSGSSD